MIERVVLIKLKATDATPEQRAAIAEATATTLSKAEGAGAADWRSGGWRTRRDWNLCLHVVLDDVEALVRYRVDPVHRAYADVFVKAMVEKIHVFDFERFGAG